MDISEGDPQITDVILVPSPYAHACGNPGRPEEYFDGSLRITEELWLADFDVDFARAVLDACSSAGSNFSPTRQYGAPYGFVRASAPAPRGRELHFDNDNRLFACVAMSRLVQPTSAGYQYSARIREWKNGYRQIIPYRPHHLNPYAYVNDVRQDWLIPSDVPEIAAVVNAYYTQKPPRRVLNALWHLETVFRNYYIEVRWPLVVTGLESLIHIAGERDSRNASRYAGSTRVFVQRLIGIGKARPSIAVSEAALREIYDRRSTLAHGLTFGTMNEPDKGLYKLAEDLLRNILRNALLDRSFADTFASDSAVQAAYPLS